VSTVHPKCPTTLARWCVATGVLVALSTGCSSHDRAGSTQTHPARPTESAVSRALAECSRRIDTLIAARLTPAADRDYAIGMCQEHPAH
jgi:hypothetical protein